MKTKLAQLLIPLLSISATSAFASESAMQDGGGLAVWFFIGFGALVIMAQSIPALIMLYSMLKAVVSPSETTATANTNSK